MKITKEYNKDINITIYSTSKKVEDRKYQQGYYQGNGVGVVTNRYYNDRLVHYHDYGYSQYTRYEEGNVYGCIIDHPIKTIIFDDKFVSPEILKYLAKR